jgi:hypothetical protein
MDIKTDLISNKNLDICCFCENTTNNKFTAFMRNDINIILNKFFNIHTLMCCHYCFKNNLHENNKYIQNYLYNKYKIIYIGEFYTNDEIVLYNTKKTKKKYKLYHKYSIFYINNNKRPYKIYTLIKNNNSNIYNEVLHELNKEHLEPFKISNTKLYNFLSNNKYDKII